MSAGRPTSAHVSRKGRKKNPKKEDESNRTFSLDGIPSIMYWSHSDSYCGTVPFLMDLARNEHDTGHSDMVMDTSESDRVFQFQLLPDLCKLKIWGLLKSCDLGRCMLVCLNWHSVLQNPHFWSVIKFSELPGSCLPRDRNGPIHTDPVCHHCFRKRVLAFTQFLSKIHPVVKEFQFCLDISHPTDQFNLAIEQFLATAELSSLTCADMNWKESPSRTLLRITNETSQDQEWIYRYRKRQRMFSRIFETFVCIASQLTTLIMPFDWTEHNVENLCNLKKLKNLVLERYGSLNHVFTQELLNQLMRSLVNLKKLLLEVWIPNQIMGVYCIESTSLFFLDVSQCRGFYLNRLNTPNLLQLRLATNSLQRNYFQRQSPQLPCMYTVLSAGAPKLEEINGHHFGIESSEHPSEEMCNLLGTLCCCLQHARIGGIEMYGL
ncbi:unnamed protein product [Lymnaea stagnalis]|uniref:F-box domain-containing protein n=1 Tax=Lymnaea stagnalis TaxID=6523 RepID=A0AAV2HDM1_LYMST